MNKKTKSIILYIALFLALILAAMFVMNMVSGTAATYRYSDVIQLFHENKVEAFTLDLGSGELKMQLRPGAQLNKVDPQTGKVVPGKGGTTASQPSSQAGGTSSGSPASSDAGSAASGPASSGAVSSQAPSGSASQGASSTASQSTSSKAGGNNFLGALMGGNGNQQEKDKIITYRVPNVSLFVKVVEKYVDDYNAAHPDDQIEYDMEPAKDNTWLITLLPTLLLGVLLVVSLVVMMKQTSGGGMSKFGRANMKNPVQSGKKTTFAEVAGADEEKEELAEIVEFLKNPSKFNDLGARIPKGVLLDGPSRNR